MAMGMNDGSGAVAGPLLENLELYFSPWNGYSRAQARRPCAQRLPESPAGFQ